MESVRDGKIRAQVCALISDNPDAPALSIAKSFGVPAKYVDPMKKGARFSPEGEAAYLREMSAQSPDLVVLAGFMRILPDSIVAAFDGKMINLHPSLLPLYKGKDSIRRAFEAGEKRRGCSVHFVSGGLYGGGVFWPKGGGLLPTDTLETLEERVHKAEHELLPSVVADFVEGKIK